MIFKPPLVEKFSAERQPSGLIFYLLLLLSNLLLLAPFVVFSWEQESWRSLLSIQVELLIMVLVWSLVKWLRKPIFLALFYLIFIFFLVYNLYDTLVRNMFGWTPNLFEEVQLVRNGLPSLIRYSNLSPLIYVAVVVGILAVLILAYYLFKTLLQSAAAAHFLGKLLLLGVLIFAFLAREETAVFHSTIANLNQNILASQTSQQELIAFEEKIASVHDAYDYSGVTLLEKPNINFIFLESYGDILYTHPDLNEPYTSILPALNEQLTDDGWHVASKLSWTPVFGGGSWLAYTTVLTGQKIQTEPEYEAILTRFPDGSYPHLPNYLQSQGYGYYRISPVPRDPADEEQWQKAIGFHTIDRWYTLDDMDAYEGELYGWGPAPPDQYTLNFFNEIREEAFPDQPKLNFFITHNSHIPWGEQPEVVDDWQALAAFSDAPPPTNFPTASVENYMEAITYQLNMAVDFIVKEGDEDDIFIVMGDHQPSQIADPNGSPFVPMHVIGKDLEFINDFYWFEFEETLFIEDLEYGVFQEGIYSMFMRAFLGNYSDTPVDDLPEYLPLGYVTEEEIREANGG